MLIALRHCSATGLLVDGEPVRARVVLVANNAYKLDLLSVGERERLDEGRLHLYIATGILRAHWEERSASGSRSTRGAGRCAAIDGEPARLETPVGFRIEPRALRVLVPPA